MVMKELIKRIENCNLCEDARFENLVNSKNKPYLELKVHPREPYEDIIKRLLEKCR